jgi:exportin-2 (importin alpha re-exporter)
MFEDDPAEFVRRDLEGSDNDTRRQAAIEITRALIEQFQKEVTAIITRYVQNYLQVLFESNYEIGSQKFP